ncbi:hypothetical protein D9619_001936 [Psilocybe cf. subviscida]|uniref:Uncharacterized protein n=1 Tax=Psilocybe cf. subviscida TaxID=2480587 RepID=A0A8H5BED9_9AGAR|nr:hypothetical protein D9619_001936 [Psilocybe cf. subviscida]
MAVSDLPPAYNIEMNAARSSQPPALSCSPLVPPNYSPEPLPDEETVSFTPRVHSHTSSSSHGHFTRQWPQATLILRDQDPETRLPTYGRGGRIVGELGLTNPEKIERVTIKLSGQMSLSVADSGSSSTSLISDTYLLWKNPGTSQQNKPGSSSGQRGSASSRRSSVIGTPTAAASSSSSEPSSSSSTSDENSTPAADHPTKCPSILPISIPFPTTYRVDGRYWRLPPSFEATFLGIPALFVRCMYTLSVSIMRTRSYRLASWTTSKTYITMLCFRPRTRPHQPIVVQDTVYASIKPSPEDWTQVVTTMGTRHYKTNVEGLKPIECHRSSFRVIFVVSVNCWPTIFLSLSNRIPTFALTDPIPFHLQLHSSLKSFRELLPANSALLTPYTGTSANGGFQPIESRILQGDKSICITIARQVVVEINGRRRFRTFLAGVAKLRPVPPLLETPSSAYLSEEAARRPPSSTKRASAMDARQLGQDATAIEDNQDVTLDWAGEVVTFAEITTGGFSANSLIVKFIYASFPCPRFRLSVICVCSSRLFVSLTLLRPSWPIVDITLPTATCDRSSISLTTTPWRTCAGFSGAFVDASQSTIVTSSTAAVLTSYQTCDGCVD